MLNHLENERDFLKALREGTSPSERSREYWTDEEKEELRQYFMDDEGISQIAIALQRSENAIVQQLIALKWFIPTGTAGSRSGRDHKCRCPRWKENGCPFHIGGGCRYLESCDDLLTAEEACEVLKIGENALYELLGAGTLKGFRNGRVWRIPKQAIVEYIKAQAKLS